MQTETGANIGASFDPLGEHLQDPFPIYAMARAVAPVFFAPRIQSWCVARHTDVRDDVTFPA